VERSGSQDAEPQSSDQVSIGFAASPSTLGGFLSANDVSSLLATSKWVSQQSFSCRFWRRSVASVVKRRTGGQK